MRSITNRKLSVVIAIIPLFLLSFTGLIAQEVEGNPLDPVKTDHPRATMKSFMDAMNDYREAIENGSPDAEDHMAKAIQCLDLSEANALTKDQTARESAIFLKETIDRIIVVDYDLIPEELDEAGDRIQVWQLRKTPIRIHRVVEGEREGEYLFSPDTVADAKRMYAEVKDLPFLDGSGQGAAYEPPWLEEHMPEWMKPEFAYLNIWQWIGIALAVFVGLVFKVLISWLVELLKKLATKSKSEWDDLIIEAVASPIGYLAAAGLWYVALIVLRLEGTALSIFSIGLRIFISVILIWLVYRMAEVLSTYLKNVADATESTLDDQLVPLFSRTIKIMVVIIGILISIQNLGVNVLSLLAGLGIGGLAFALAARDTVANFFGSLMILFDRPFQVGEWIKVGGAEGTVEEIGFRSTRIRTFYDSVVSIPNSEIANAHIDNMGRREYRRVFATLGVRYDTSAEKLEAFMEGIKNVIKANPNTRKDYFHVVFSGYGASSLDIMLYFFLQSPDWSEELVERQNVYLEILRLAKNLGVEFAYPTQTLQIETFPEKKPTYVAPNSPESELRSIPKAFGPGGEAARPGGQGFFVPPARE